MTNPVFADRVQETFTTTGTGTISLGGPVTGYQAFSAALTNGQTCYYGATDGTNWEIGLGTYATSGNTLARTDIIASSNANAAVNWAAGTKSIWLDLPAILSQIGQMLGTNTNDNASAGNVGEYITAATTTTNNNCSNNTAKNITSISLTAGDWDLSATGILSLQSGTSSTGCSFSINTVTATMASPPNGGGYAAFNGSLLTSGNPDLALALGPMRVQPTSTTTYYLNAIASFSGSTAGVWGQIRARRVR